MIDNLATRNPVASDYLSKNANIVAEIRFLCRHIKVKNQGLETGFLEKISVLMQVLFQKPGFFVSHVTNSLRSRSLVSVSEIQFEVR
ncbi:hypothetical protein [Planktothricoides raciborskii]|uniref:Uncharacterized protein n=1 Tax=Planktothricoides raciborskii FACHB-1370 TaxID=2949576 RepID=A0ABR8E886_9CYAN|nr:hypothetical protein [Planktothricoides raciborskii]MBD2542617.1 hypothetical protein [Planktothricoides raciborskii FACHB-1370]MBD2581074.1 hypothetical protein [Planktothricoides raciborskii FACHB-1261]